MSFGKAARLHPTLLALGVVLLAAIALPSSTGATNLNEVKKLVASDGEAGDFFGFGVGLSGDTAVVGAYHDDANGSSALGAAYIYERDVGGVEDWGQVKKLSASDSNELDFFGFSVAIDGDTIVVGTPEQEAPVGRQAGAAYVYQRDVGGADNWGEVKKLTASDAEAVDEFGWKVGISGDTLVVGAHLEDTEGNAAGAAYIFERDQGGADNWGEVKKLTASDGASLDTFGRSVAIRDDIIVIGASEKAYVFQRSHGGPGSWGEAKKLTASDAESGDSFGVSVASSAGTAVVGANAEDAGGQQAGAAYVYQRDHGGTSNWGEVKKLTASDAEANDDFGLSAAVHGDVVIVGADGDDIPGGGPAAGAAYVYERNEGGTNNWGEVSKLTASDATGSAVLGVSVAVSDFDALAGAYFENQSAGAAYVFDILQPKPQPVGGIAPDSDLQAIPLETPKSEGSPRALFIGVVAVVCLLAAGGAALWSRPG